MYAYFCFLLLKHCCDGGDGDSGGDGDGDADSDSDGDGDGDSGGVAAHRVVIAL